MPKSKKLYRNLIPLVAGALLLSGCSSVSFPLQAAAAVTQEDVDAALPGIVCWGDSLTYGDMGDGVNYPEVLEALIDERLIEPIREATGNEELTAPEVVNLGVNKESSLEIAGRQGGVPLIVQEDFTIPADCTEVSFTYCSSIRESTTKLIRESDGGVQTVTICGIEGELVRWYDTEADFSRYNFLRLEEGESVSVSAGELVLTNLYDEYLDYIPIIMMGNNGDWTDNADLASQFQAMLDHSESDAYIVVPNPVNNETDVERMQTMDDYMSACFGDNAISLRQWMIENGLQTAADSAGEEVSISGEDAARIEAGLIPLSLMNEDEIHFNSTGYAVMAEMFYEKLDELGYFDALKALAQ